METHDNLAAAVGWLAAIAVVLVEVVVENAIWPGTTATDSVPLWVLPIEIALVVVAMAAAYRAVKNAG